MLRHALRRGANITRRRFSEAAAVSAPPKVPQPPVPPPDDDAALTPRKICDELDTHIVGQDAAKRAVAIALRNRWRRQLLGEELRAEVVPKNILMIGPTGCGMISASCGGAFTSSKRVVSRRGSRILTRTAPRRQDGDRATALEARERSICQGRSYQVHGGGLPWAGCGPDHQGFSGSVDRVNKKTKGRGVSGRSGTSC